MLMFHPTRMGFPTYVPAYYPTENSYWTPAYPPNWYHQSHYPNMTEIIDDIHNLPSTSPHSEDSTNSSNLSDYRISEHFNNENSDYFASFKIHTNPVEGEYEVLKCHNDVSLNSHEKNNQCDTEFKCKWKNCTSVFNTMYSLSDHVASVHSDAIGGLFYCKWEGCIRDKGFNARYKMLVHVRTHTNEKPHRCSQCNKSFSRAENLKIHIRSHSGEKPYVCPVEGCNKAYSNSSDRFKHTRTHSVDKPYYCKIPGCQKRYTDPSSLRKHVKTYKHIIVTAETDKSLETRDSYIGSKGFENTVRDEDVTQPIKDNVLQNDNVTSRKRKYSYLENEMNSEEMERRPSSTESNIFSNPHVEPVECQNVQIDEEKFRGMQLEYQYSDEPLNLKKQDTPIYENGVLNLQKRLKKTESDDFIECKLVDIPLDLSLRKSFS